MYPHVFVAGTFDRLHKGHEAVLDAAFAQGEKVTIGLTSDEYVKKYKKQQNIQSFFARKKYLQDWLGEKKYDIVAIEDPYEPAVSADFDALVVTPDNKARGEEINAKRREKNLPEIVLVEVPLVRAEDKKIISSTRIRNLVLPDGLRPELVKPLGQILVGDAIGSSIEKNRDTIIITVGDVTTEMFFTAGVIPQLAIVDFLVGRKPHTTSIPEHMYRIELSSGPGFISQEAIAMIQKWAMHPADKTLCVVSGEEDLLVLPAVFYAPLGTIVYYGQPKVGLVEVTVTEEKKKEAHFLLQSFDTP